MHAFTSCCGLHRHHTTGTMNSSKPNLRRIHRKSKNKIFIEGLDEYDPNPFTSLKKLFHGFCDPARGGDYEDSTTIASTPSSRAEIESRSKEFVVEGPGLFYGYNNRRDSRDNFSVPDDESFKTAALLKLEPPEEEEKYEEEEEEEVRHRDIPILKATNYGSKLRVRRGVEVAIYSIFAVIVTLVALHRLGHQMDLKVVETQLRTEKQKMINIVFNEKSKSGVPLKARESITVAFKEEMPVAGSVPKIESQEDISLQVGVHEKVSKKHSDRTTVDAIKESDSQETKESDSEEESENSISDHKVRPKMIVPDISSFDEAKLRAYARKALKEDSVAEIMSQYESRKSEL